MARTRYEREDFDSNRSIAEYRRDMARKIEHSSTDYYAREGTEHKHHPSNVLQGLTQPVQRLTQDAIFHAKIDDPAANVARNAKRFGATVLDFAEGAALIVAATAVTALHTERVDREAERLKIDVGNLEKEYAALEKSLGADATSRSTMTLSDYRADVDNAQEFYKEKIINAHQEYREVERAVDQQRQEINEQYSRDKTALQVDRQREENHYQNSCTVNKNQYDQSVASINERETSAREAHAAAVQEHNAHYDAEIKKVQESTTLSAKEKEEKIQSFNRERADGLDELAKSHEKELRTFQSQRDDAMVEYARADRAIQKDHERAVSTFDSREHGIEASFRHEHKVADQRLQDAQTKKSDTIKDASEQRRSLREASSEMRKEDADSRDSKMRKIETHGRHLADSERETRTIEHHHIFTGKTVTKEAVIGRHANSEAVDLVRSINKSSKAMAEDAIMALGTKEDIALLQKVRQDNEDRKAHNAQYDQFREQKGRKEIEDTRAIRRAEKQSPFISKLTEEDKAQYQKLIMMYGATGNANGAAIDLSVKNQKTTAAILEKRANESEPKLQILKKEIQESSSEINALRKKVSESDKAKRALAANPNMSEAEKAALKGKILSSRQTKQAEALIKTKETALLEKQKAFNKLNQSITADRKLAASLKKNAELVEKNKNRILAIQEKGGKNGKAWLKAGGIFGAGKVASKLSQKAASKFKSSSRGIQKRIEAKALTGNAMHRELKHMKRSLKNAGQVYSFAINGTFIVAGVAAKMIFFPITANAFIGKKINARQAKLLGKQKAGKTLTARQSKWLERMSKNKMMLGASKLANMGGKFGKFTRFTKNVALAPVKVLDLPNKIMNLPQTAMIKTAQLTLKGSAMAVKGVTKLGGKVGRAALRPVGKGIKYVHGKTLGKLNQKFKKATKSAWNKFRKSKLANKFKAFGNKVASPFKKAGAFVKNIGKKIASLLKKLLAPIISAIASLLSFLWTALMYALLFALGLLSFLLIAIVIIALLFSVLAAIWEWLKSKTAAYDADLRNNPTYIMHMAANYRAEELKIWHFFATGGDVGEGRNPKNEEKRKEGDKEYTVVLEVSADPLFYEIYDHSFHWFWEDVGGQKAITDGHNANAEGVLKYLKNVKYKDSTQCNPGSTDVERGFSLKAVWNWFCHLFMPDESYKEMQDDDCEVWSDIGHYKDMTVYYYNSDDVTLKEDPQFVKDNPGAKIKAMIVDSVPKESEKKYSSYEISNAKDALAIGDALYQGKEGSVTTYEVLGYLGVGDLQVCQYKKDSSNNLVSVGQESLFWKTHQVVYLEGTKSQDVYYHGTSMTPTKNGNTSLYPLTIKTVYYNGTNHTIDEKDSKYDSGGCDNYQTKVIHYKLTTTTTWWESKHNSTYEYKSWLTADGDIIRSDFNVSASVFNYYRQSQTMTANQMGNYIEFIKSFSKEPSTSLFSSIQKYSSGAYSFYYKEGVSDEGRDIKAYYNLSKWGETWTDFASYGIDTTKLPNTIYCIKQAEREGSFAGNAHGYYLVDEYGKLIDNTKVYYYFDELKDPTHFVRTWSSAEGTPSLTGLTLPRNFVLHKKDGENKWVMNIYYLSAGTSQAPHQKVNKLLPSLNSSSGYFSDSQITLSVNQTFSCGDNHKGDSNHGEWKSSEHTDDLTDKVEVCCGHIKLRAAVVVSTIDSKYSLLDAAATLPHQDGGYEFHIYCSDKEAAVSGWGGVTKPTYTPSEDWAKGSDLRDLAFAKAHETEMRYEYTEDFDKRAKELTLLSYKRNKIASIAKGPDGNVAWVLWTGKDLYYTPSLSSGKQHNIPIYTASGDYHYPTLSNKLKYLDLFADGYPYRKVKDTP